LSKLEKLEKYWHVFSYTGGENRLPAIFLKYWPRKKSLLHGHVGWFKIMFFVVVVKEVPLEFKFCLVALP
jgi:hypothetical protein